jgi:hypothetical protein
MRLRRHYDLPEQHGESFAPDDRCFIEPLEDRMNLVPDGLPFGTFAGQVELGQYALEPVNYLGMALKPWIDPAFVKEGFYLVHQVFARRVR